MRRHRIWCAWKNIARAARRSPLQIVRRVSVDCLGISSASSVHHGGRQGAGARVEREERAKAHFRYTFAKMLTGKNRKNGVRPPRQAASLGRAVLGNGWEWCGSPHTVVIYSALAL